MRTRRPRAASDISVPPVASHLGRWRSVEVDGGRWRSVEVSGGRGGRWRSVEVGGGRWRSVEVGGGQWRSVEVGGGRWRSVEVGGGRWRSVEVEWRSVEVGGGQWRSVEVGGGRWRSVEVGGGRWRSVEVGEVSGGRSWLLVPSGDAGPPTDPESRPHPSSLLLFGCPHMFLCERVGPDNLLLLHKHQLHNMFVFCSLPESHQVCGTKMVFSPRRPLGNRQSRDDSREKRGDNDLLITRTSGISSCFQVDVFIFYVSGSSSSS
ncbi:unnamed protein product [Pleuronectes platessa]|uniref:Uncharacterized protein n=1 Tax=Pleuronectes platessa TaxID=8262 RepID=A0A9N7Z5X9_PLEPL|nr:unnamed protein product [Pleuronectes platessa]